MKVLLVFIAVLVVVAADAHHRKTHHSKSDGKNHHEYSHQKDTKTHTKTDGKNHHVYSHQKDKTHTKTRSKTDGKNNLVYCPKPDPPVYGSVQENNAKYQTGCIIHYSCNYGYELYGSSWNKCVYEYGVAKWEYPVPICKPKVYSV
eukprot:Em0008g984a